MISHDEIVETDGVKSVSVTEGESVILQNDATELQKDDLIVWRFGDKGVLLAKIDVETKELSLNDADERFRNRLQLDQNGSLTITNARPEHTGLYEVQVKGRKSSQQFLVSVSADLGWSSTVMAGIVVAVLLLAGLLAAVVIYYRHWISKLEKQVAEEEKVEGMEGRTVVLNTGTTLQNGDEIKWWFGDDKNPITQNSEWISTDADISCDVTDERFRNKVQLGGGTGDLIICYIRTIHSGVYKVQISSKTRIKNKRFIVTVNVGNVSVKVGQSVTLKTDIKIQEGDLILWTFGVKNGLIVKAESGKTSISESFRGRLQLNDRDGSLTITNITNADFGHFQLQVLNSERNRFRRFNVIKECRKHTTGHVTRTIQSGSPFRNNIEKMKEQLIIAGIARAVRFVKCLIFRHQLEKQTVNGDA
ncbi:uncharacterized protein LOC107667287 [Sinocyclocheilus anshuiensis]|uniref:uncharacterized protein LOC107667287 n=1 Tax=Sinocyclocheilus anshuiensis TaxID=1608454 RepID=UPI0007B86E3E|nr:PREDICTED: uncharacterized protein LOC107667287 [Sinocyclocheilus anshuiensis]